MLKHSLTIAFRKLIKNIGFSLINIFGLALGLAVFIFIFQFVSFELSYDNFHKNGDHLYRVESQFFKNNELTDDWATSSTGYGLAMKNEYPEIVDVTRVWLGNSESVVQFEDIKYRERNVVAADESFFQMFSFPMIQGSPKLSLKEPNTVVISESYKKKYFGNENPIGKILKISDVQNTYSCEVTGIFKDFPSNSHLHYDIIFSWATVSSGWKAMDDFWYLHKAYTYVSLHSPTDVQYIESDFPNLAEKNKTLDALKDVTWGVKLVPIKDIHLNTWKAEEMEIKGSRRVVWFLSIMAFLIMVIAWINYTNLSTIKSIESIKEVGIRKTIGVERHKLIFQFLLESFLLSMIAAIISILLVILARHWSIEALPGINIPFEITPKIVLSLLLLLIVGIVISGIYPALVLSSIKPAHALKGQVKNSLKGNLLRKILISFQFIASIILISSTFLIYKQLQFMKNREIGISIDQIITINAPASTKNYITDIKNFKNEILQHSEIQIIYIFQCSTWQRSGHVPFK